MNGRTAKRLRRLAGARPIDRRLVLQKRLEPVSGARWVRICLRLSRLWGLGWLRGLATAETSRRVRTTPARAGYRSLKRLYKAGRVVADADGLFGKGASVRRARGEKRRLRREIYRRVRAALA